MVHDDGYIKDTDLNQADAVQQLRDGQPGTHRAERHRCGGTQRCVCVCWRACVRACLRVCTCMCVLACV